jgi:hypothetical protein
VVLLKIYENLSLEDMEGEIWKNVEGYEGLYQISNMGRVKTLGRKVKNTSLKRGYRETKDKILKQSIDRYGYLKVVLNKETQKGYFTVHRLVALAFIDNPLNKPSVDHKNTIRTDNRVKNLRWLTAKEQLNDNELSKIRHFEALEKATNSLKKKVRCITTGEEFECINDAVRKYNIGDGCIIKCCKGRQKYTGRLTGQKLQWEYID